MWPDVQSRFAEALADPGLAPPAPAGRFAVYRNNVAVSLNDALGETFPVVKAMVGAEFFSALAGEFRRAAPPSTPVLSEWGGDFADFIHRFEPLRDYPYLPDLARLEWRWLRAYHAEDAAPAAIDLLGSKNTTALEAMKLQLHPSIGLVASPWPVVSIWQAHQEGAAENALSTLPDAGETALILRPEMTVEIAAVQDAEAQLIKALIDGASLGEALDRAAEKGDPSDALASLFRRGAVTGLGETVT